MSQRGHGAAARRGARADPRVIHRLPIPTPFRVGRVNCYLIEDDPLTLVDVGPNSARSLVALEDALREHGHRIEDLERIVITHQHTDHLGLVGILAERSGRRGVRARPARAGGRGLRRPRRPQRRAGPGADAAPRDRPRRGHRARPRCRAPSAAGAAAPRSTHTARRRRRAGASPAARCRCCTAPGTRPSDTVFFDAARRQLLAGDHLIKNISSNPLIAQPLGGRSGEPGSGRPRTLIMYMESLRETQAMPVDDRAPRPRRAVRRPRGADRRPLRDARAAGGQDARPDREQPRSAHDIAQAIWGNVAVTQAFLTLSEVLGPRRPAARARRGRRGRARRRRAVHYAVVDEVEIILVALLVSVAVLSAAARAINVPYPIVLVIGGAIMGLAPLGLPEVELDPDLVLVIFLPPLLYSGAFFANLRDLRADLRVDLAAVDRARAGDDGRGRRRRPRDDRRALVAGGVRARRDRRPDRPGGGDRDRPPAGRPAPAGLDPRGRGADQRRDRARRLPDRASARRHGVLAARRGLGLPVDGGGRDRGRARRRLGDHRRSASGSTTRWSRTRSGC